MDFLRDKNRNVNEWYQHFAALSDEGEHIMYLSNTVFSFLNNNSIFQNGNPFAAKSGDERGCEVEEEYYYGYLTVIMAESSFIRTALSVDAKWEEFHL